MLPTQNKMREQHHLAITFDDAEISPIYGDQAQIPKQKTPPESKFKIRLSDAKQYLQIR